MYTLDNSFARGHFTVIVVGCGGTGGFVAEGLCRLLPFYADLVLVDPDRVEERNLGRQNFTRQDLGRFKSEALAQRLAREFGRRVAYSVLPAALMTINRPGLVIGCVDNGLARRDIAKRVSDWRYTQTWWLDAGNGENYGQVLIGNRYDPVSSFDARTDTCRALPLPTIQRPELLADAPRTQDCADMAEEQGPTINQAMAALVLEVTARLIRGRCPWMQLYLDMDAGTLVPVAVTPEAVERLTGISKRKLVSEGR